jgi:hypothetical protein
VFAGQLTANNGQFSWRSFSFTRNLHGWQRVVASGSGLYAYSPSGSILWSLPAQGPKWSSPTVANDGTIYIVVNTDLYSLQGTNGPEHGPWPIFRRDAKHNARLIQRGLSLPTTIPGGGVSLTMNTETGHLYSLLYSTNLQNWAELTNFTPVHSPTTVIDAPGEPARFYRLQTSQ